MKFVTPTNHGENAKIVDDAREMVGVDDHRNHGCRHAADSGRHRAQTESAVSVMKSFIKKIYIYINFKIYIARQFSLFYSGRPIQLRLQLDR